MTAPAGYTFDDESLAPSPVTQEDLQRLLTDVMWTDEDAAALASIPLRTRLMKTCGLTVMA